MFSDLFAHLLRQIRQPAHHSDENHVPAWFDLPVVSTPRSLMRAKRQPDFAFDGSRASLPASSLPRSTESKPFMFSPEFDAGTEFEWSPGPPLGPDARARVADSLRASAWMSTGPPHDPRASSPRRRSMMSRKSLAMVDVGPGRRPTAPLSPIAFGKSSAATSGDAGVFDSLTPRLERRRRLREELAASAALGPRPLHVLSLRFVILYA